MQVAGCAHLHTTLNKSRDEKLDPVGTAPPYELGKRVVDMVYTLYSASLTTVLKNGIEPAGNRSLPLKITRSDSIESLRNAPIRSNPACNLSLRFDRIPPERSDSIESHRNLLLG